MSDAERSELVGEVLDRLEVLAADHVLLIEGSKDRRALHRIGIDGDMFLMQSSGGPVKAVEYVESKGGKAVVLTDWDRRGDSLAAQIREIASGYPDVDFSVRDDLASLCRIFIKDVESLDSLVFRLNDSC